MSSNEKAVITKMMFAASPAQAWDGLMFFEEIERTPPLHLRLLLPVPIRTEGSKSKVGDEARCLYRGGHLIKRIIRIDLGRSYEFAVVEQDLAIGGGMKLAGGGYKLREVAADRTEVTLATRYFSPRRPRWVWRSIERMVCHLFHRHILAAMRLKVEPRR